MTGILDRLQRGGWVVRERDPEAADRRTGGRLTARPPERHCVGHRYVG
jgi:DNA-binding MarR family transcriptional regulator